MAVRGTCRSHSDRNVGAFGAPQGRSYISSNVTQFRNYDSDFSTPERSETSGSSRRNASKSCPHICVLVKE